MKDIFPDFEKINKMNVLISTLSTGTVEEFANQFNCHPRTMQYAIKRLNEELKPQKISINYNKVLRSYQYSRPGNIVVEFKFVKEN